MPTFIQYLKNRCRSMARRSSLGRLCLQMFFARPQQRIRFVSATRCSEKNFWTTTPLGKSLRVWLKDSNVKACIRFNNTDGLSAVYNEHLQDSDLADIFVFVHDDVWLTDSFLLEKLRLALRRFDVVGLAGNRRRLPRQPAWLYSHHNGSEFVWDWPWLSGSVAHGKPEKFHLMEYGPSPSSCQLLDGVFIAVSAELLKASTLRFDERFMFDFYDMDFCRSACKLGLALGTWPISIIHQSGGAFGKPSWDAAYHTYLEKWRK